MPYTPNKPPKLSDPDAQALAFYVEDELERLAGSLVEGRRGTELDPNFSPPVRPRLGLLAYADGVRWNPGSGEGLYTYNSRGFWEKATPRSVDVRDFGAVGDGATSDDAAIQAAIDYVYSNFTSGKVTASRGNYKLTTTGITMKGGVRLVGEARAAVTLNGFLSPAVTPVTFDSSCVRGSSLEQATVLGYYNANPALVTVNTIVIAPNIPVVLNDVTAWYGLAGLFTQGIDGTYSNCWFIGCQDGVVSTGANWYNRCIMDGNGSFATNRYAFYQGAPAGIVSSQENHFVHCDFSGSFTESLHIDDGGGGTFTVLYFNGCVLSAPINVINSYFISYVGCEFGSAAWSRNAVTGGTISVVSCVGFGVVIGPLGAGYVLAANLNIT